MLGKARLMRNFLRRRFSLAHLRRSVPLVPPQKSLGPREEPLPIVRRYRYLVVPTVHQHQDSGQVPEHRSAKFPYLVALDEEERARTKDERNVHAFAELRSCGNEEFEKRFMRWCIFVGN